MGLSDPDAWKGPGLNMGGKAQSHRRKTSPNE